MLQTKWFLILIICLYNQLNAQITLEPAGAMANTTLNRGHYLETNFSPINQIAYFNDSIKLSVAAHFNILSAIPEFKQSDLALILASKNFNYSLFMRQIGIPNFKVWMCGTGISQKISSKLSYGWSFTNQFYMVKFFNTQYSLNANVACNYKLTKHTQLYSELFLPISVNSNPPEYKISNEPELSLSSCFQINHQVNIITSYSGNLLHDNVSIAIQKLFSKGLKASIGLHVKTSKVAFGISMRLHQFEVSNAAIFNHQLGINNHLSMAYVKKH
jgi:hypothetical protein